MTLKVTYFENQIEFLDDHINVIEIENKKYFYRFINNLYKLNEEEQDSITFYEQNEEKKFNKKIKIYLDFFDLQFHSKKTNTEILKYLSDSIAEEDKITLQKEYSKVIKIFKKMINNFDLPLTIEEEINTETISKTFQLKITEKDNLLDNLLLLIDLENTLKLNNILVFVNLKQYLSKNELIELYKYSIYNKIRILLLDSQSYGGTIKYEKKLIIDENLDEFML